MEKLNTVATFPAIPAESLDEFKAKASEAIGIVASEEGTLTYDWYFSDDETTCTVIEAYASSEALLSHMGNVGHLLEPMVSLGGGLTVDFYGDPSPELAEAAAAFNPTVHNHFGSK